MSVAKTINSITVSSAGGKVVPVSASASGPSVAAASNLSTRSDHQPNAGQDLTSGGSHSSAGNTHVRYKPGAIGIFFFGINMVMCGQYMGWNLALSAGAGTWLAVCLVMGLAYVAFLCCVAEVTSALPFAGGSFGLARCTLGFFPAFLIACAETLEYTSSLGIQAISVSDILIKAAPSLADYKPLIWLVVFYVPVTLVQCMGGAPFWVVSTVLGATQTLLVVVYCCGSIGDVSFSDNASVGTPLFAGGFSETMGVFPFAAWVFLGIEILNLASDDVQSPKIAIPRTQVAFIATIFMTVLCVLLTAVSLPMVGGIPALSAELTPLDNGFARIFRIDPNLVTLLTLPAQYAGGYGFFWAASKLLYAMGSSRLLPSWLATTSSRYGTPYMAMLTVAVIGYAVCLLVYYVAQATVFLIPLCLLFAFVSYTGQCIGYIALKLRYPIMKQSAFKSPFGVYGALYAMCVWLTGITGILGFLGHPGVELALFGVLLVVLGVYYVLVAKKRQIMSEEESRVLLTVHITRFNSKKKSRRSTTTGHSTKQSSRTSKASTRVVSFRQQQQLPSIRTSNHNVTERGGPPAMIEPFEEH